MICLAKGIASGLPLGALVARADCMNWPPGSHASTFGGNPVSCRAALATLDLVQREYMANAAARGRDLLDGLGRLCSSVPCLANPRGLGLMVAVDVVNGAALDARRRDEVIQAAFHKGLLLLGCGKAGIRFSPALCVTSEQVATALSILEEACRSPLPRS
jgi:4-aminobutyrate aminotransferase